MAEHSATDGPTDRLAAGSPPALPSGMVPAVAWEGQGSLPFDAALQLPQWVHEDPTLVRMDGVVRRVIYASPAGEFSVVELEESGTQAPLVVVGALVGIQLGESVHAVGRWEKHAQHGRQLRVELALPLGPQTLRGIERYFQTLTGIGPELARRIVERYGVDSLTILETELYRIAEIKGVGKRRAQKALADALSRREEREVMIFLQGLGISAAFAVRIRRRYAQHAVQQVKRDPYALAREVAGIGFQISDRIARSVGIALTSPLRVEAALCHVLDLATDAGHCYLPIEELSQRTVGLLTTEPVSEAECPQGWPEGSVAEAQQTLLVRGELVAEGDAIYRTGMYQAERSLAEALMRLLRATRARVPQIEEHAKNLPIDLAPAQLMALLEVERSPVSIITGGPGTGKTTIIRALVEAYRRRGLEVRLVAPTGRAARRLSEACGHAASTIHRLLELRPGELSDGRRGSRGTGGGETGAGRMSDREIEAELIVCDEASMLDLGLALALVLAVVAGKTLVFVGDADQLPSVGPGRVLADLIASRTIPVTRLSQVFRQAEGSGIAENAQRILAGELPLSVAGEEGDGGTRDYYFVTATDPKIAQERVLRLVCERIPERFGFDPCGDVQVLTPMHRSEVGTEELNRALQARLQPTLPALIQGNQAISSRGRHFVIGDKVMQTKNDRDRDVYNGDVGIVSALDRAEGILCVRFDERDVMYDKDATDQLEHAYAISVHKSQGSEYKAVVIPLLMTHYPLLRRNLFYTAVTRGKKLVVVVGDPRALRRAVTEIGDLSRYTSLARRLADL